MRHGVLCALLALSLGGAALMLGGVHLLWLWPALSLYITAIAYFENQPRWLGKRPDGSLSWWSWVVLGPWISFSLAVAWVLRLMSREAPHAELSGLRFGRRLGSSELPRGIFRVIDLTAELPEPRCLRSKGYVCIPMLDTRSLQAHELVTRLSSVASDEATYVHCAQGHGRTGLVVAALLLLRGTANTPSEALALIHTVRPAVRLSKEQHATLSDVAELLSSPAS
ncbi:MAG: dual specificity protein phosphatase family protein [Myxococcales bacterium]|nr:dual specificity protein phosphatase family protein [Myxococcales bacterium]